MELEGICGYLKAESETRLRFEDYLEMSVVEGTLAANGSGALAAGKKVLKVYLLL